MCLKPERIVNPLILGLDGDSVGEYIHKDSSDSMDCYILLYCDIYLFEKDRILLLKSASEKISVSLGFDHRSITILPKLWQAGG